MGPTDLLSWRLSWQWPHGQIRTTATHRDDRVSDQSPVIDQLVLIKIPRHARTLLLSSVTRPEPGPIRSFAAGDTVLTIAPAGRRRQGTRLERMLAYTSPDSEPAII